MGRSGYLSHSSGRLRSALGVALTAVLAYLLAQAPSNSLTRFPIAIGLLLLGAALSALYQHGRKAPESMEDDETLRREWISSLIREIPDGVFLLKGNEILYSNPIGERILAIQGSPSGRDAVLESVAKVLPVQLSLATAERKFHYILQAHAIRLPFADRIVVAQDVTVARESQNARGGFLGTLSHEVKTPITSITMAIRLLHRGIEQMPNPVHRSLIQTCVEELERLRLLLDDLLNLTRTDPLTQSLDPQKVDLSKLLRHAVQNFRAIAAGRGIELISSQSEGIKGRMVPIDPTKITWAIFSLLTYALQETASGGRVELTLTPSASIDGASVDTNVSYDWVVFRLKKSGPEFHSNADSGVFDKYHPDYDIRVARSGNPKVGLAIAREILATHGGQLWIEHSEICFSLPLRGAASIPAPGLVTEVTVPSQSNSPRLSS